MHRLYSISHQRVLKFLGIQGEATKAILKQSLLQKKIVQFDNSIFDVLPKAELKNLFRVPCPVKNPNTEQELIQTSKRLRSGLNIHEQHLCQKCPFHETCAFSEFEPQQIKSGENNTILDLVLYNQAMKNHSNPESINYRVWACGYKIMDNLTALLKDLSEGAPLAKKFLKVRQAHFEQVWEATKEREEAASENRTELEISGKKGVKTVPERGSTRKHRRQGSEQEERRTSWKDRRGQQQRSTRRYSRDKYQGEQNTNWKSKGFQETNSKWNQRARKVRRGDQEGNSKRRQRGSYQGEQKSNWKDLKDTQQWKQKDSYRGQRRSNRKDTQETRGFEQNNSKWNQRETQQYRRKPSSTQKHEQTSQIDAVRRGRRVKPQQ